MTTVTTYIERLQQAADKAQSAETAYRREVVIRIAALERERAFAFRRMNLMRSVAEAAKPQMGDDSDPAERSGEEIAVACALALLRTRLGWSSESEARDAILTHFAPVVIALHRASGGAEMPGETSGIDDALERFEAWYEEAHGVSFWMLFDNPMPDTPRVDF
ncbi:hypothetical protein [Phyllobacterium zundukense]|jgi:hypothetical protein|uniref:Uncharacterized protein n=1 Tax=Phyllobacterium zundukense TaxID=1867719 RepID=A0ACD4CU97_9HYPH|nr:hypothetical protein [Phyllobacterium zundukense]UXN57162.1 hypothetical protein N8E88_01685 [Phyllobacterium zundukense]